LACSARGTIHPESPKPGPGVELFPASRHQRAKRSDRPGVDGTLPTVTTAGTLARAKRRGNLRIHLKETTRTPHWSYMARSTISSCYGRGASNVRISVCDSCRCERKHCAAIDADLHTCISWVDVRDLTARKTAMRFYLVTNDFTVRARGKRKLPYDACMNQNQNQNHTITTLCTREPSSRNRVLPKAGSQGGRRRLPRSHTKRAQSHGGKERRERRRGPSGGDTIHLPRTPRRSAISAASGHSANDGCGPTCDENVKTCPSAGGTSWATRRTLGVGMYRP
jgi:hypothetical protein